MNLPGTSFTVQSSPRRPFALTSGNAIISPATSCCSTSSIPHSSCHLRSPFSAVFCPLGFGGQSLGHGLTDNNAGKGNWSLRASVALDARRPLEHHVRSRRVLQTKRFRCAAASLGNAGDGEADVGNVAGLEAPAANGVENKDAVLVSGSPVVIVEAPVMLKTAEPMPMMRPNRGVIKPGDAGRVIARRPKGLWAVRFAVGAYLIERKCFKPLDIQ